MSQNLTVQDVVNQLAEGQRHLQIIMEEQTRALTAHADRAFTTQQVQDAALLRLADAVATARVHPSVPTSILQKYQAGEDPDYFFTNFERVAATAAWPQERWGQYLAPLLSGELQAAYQAVNPSGDTAYPDIKKTVLERLGHDTEYYRIKFRKEKLGPGDSPRSLFYRIQDLGNRWLRRDGGTIDTVIDKVLLEQFMEALPPPVRAWVRQHPNISTTAAVEFACAYHRSSGPRPVVEKSLGSASANWRATLPRLPARFPVQNQLTDRPSLGTREGLQGPQCFHCGVWGHIARYCPQRPTPPEPMEVACVKGHVFCTGGREKTFVREMEVNGQVLNVLVDSGCRHTVVDWQWVPPGKMIQGSKVAITCVHGDTKVYPMAEVDIRWNGELEKVTVGVIPNLVEDVILGLDYPRFHELIQPEPLKRPVEVWLKEAPFAHADLRVEEGKSRKTRAERRKEKKRYQKENQNDKPFPLYVAEESWESHRSFRTEQREDPTLAQAWRAVQDTEQDQVGPYFLRLKGLLYRVVGLGEEKKKQLVVPRFFREQVLTLAHCRVGGGHGGRGQTEDYLLSKFYWPGVYADIRNFCASCSKCQLVNPSVDPKVPLRPLPVIGVPFSRVGMDLVGPLVISSKGHQYILVLVDYATRYPEAIPLSSMTTTVVAQAMVEFFSRVGFPAELLTDQGTPFMSRLMGQVCKILGIKQIRTSVYHPQTDGLVERYNRTIKSILRKLVSDSGRDWATKLPLVLFAIRCHVQSSLGFSPFELLFGRQPRTLLDMAAEHWEEEEDESKNLLEYATQLKDSVVSLWDKARAHLERTQGKQKEVYDRHAKPRELKVGDQVLILLPTSDNKLLAKWQGPFRVLERVTPVTYRLEIPGRRGGEQIYHINLLKKWVEAEVGRNPEQPVLMVTSTQPLSIEYPPLGVQKGIELVQLGSGITTEQKQQVKAVLHGFDSLFRGKPGRTTLVQHDIVTEVGKVVRLRPYRIPEARKVVVEKEVEEMLREGIIEPSNSPWCSPVVLVPKPNGTLRFCIDFRQLNKVSRFDTYPMPRVDELVEGLGKAEYLTTLDLTKGYWQIPLTVSAKEKTAFSTQSGLYQFKVLPFGLHGAPATFQRLMDHILRPHTAYAAAYLDDIVVFSPSWEIHLEHLTAVFSSIQQAGLTVNPEKCLVATDSIKYLGYHIQKGTIRPQVEKVQAIRDIPRPSTKKEVRSFLGLVGYYRRFIPQFSELASPLTDMLKKNRPAKITQWFPEQERSFRTLKEVLCCSPLLICPNFQKTFTLQTDASGHGLGAVLSQEGLDGELHPVVFVSRKLLERETHYATIEKECLAIKWALEALQYYLLGRTFTLVTDHAPLVWLSQNKDSNARVLRWFLALQPFSFQTVHRPGKLHGNADYLSRFSGSQWPERPLSWGRNCDGSTESSGEKMAAAATTAVHTVDKPISPPVSPEGGTSSGRGEFIRTDGGKNGVRLRSGGECGRGGRARVVVKEEESVEGSSVGGRGRSRRQERSVVEGVAGGGEELQDSTTADPRNVHEEEEKPGRRKGRMSGGAAG